MNATNKLLDKYTQICSITQDKDLAAKLRVTKQAVSGWRTEKAHPDADSVAKMCDAINEPLAHWLPLIEAERARSPEARKVWLRLAQAAACIALTIGAAPNRAQASQMPAHNAQKVSPVYIMRNVRRAWNKAKQVGTRIARLLALSHGPRAWPANATA